MCLEASTDGEIVLKNAAIAAQLCVLVFWVFCVLCVCLLDSLFAS